MVGVVMLSIKMQSVVMLSFIILSVKMQSVVMLGVMLSIKCKLLLY